MAKGNLFLGTAARSVGDVVMYRREGSQVSRVRVRKIANPKTDAQCRQRAYMAPIPKFFSPLAVVLERSFEGLSKSKSYSKFLKVNADKARANDWLLPKGIGFFPLPYQLSQGTLPAISYGTYGTQNGLLVNSTSAVSGITTIGELSAFFVDKGYQNGDVITVIEIFGTIQDGNFVPKVVQFEIDTTSEVLVTNALPGVTITTPTGPFGVVISLGSADFAGGAIIAARFENDKWRRSTQNIMVESSILTAIGTDAYKAAAIASYSNTVGEPNPMVYLDGDELANPQ